MSKKLDIFLGNKRKDWIDAKTRLDKRKD